MDGADDDEGDDEDEDHDDEGDDKDDIDGLLDAEGDEDSHRGDDDDGGAQHGVAPTGGESCPIPSIGTRTPSPPSTACPWSGIIASVKNQYFGDINDYRKYGLLRLLTNGGEIRTAVCWMLTPDDGRGDGMFIDYLGQPDTWRDFDAPLFDHLRGIVLQRGVRSVCEIQNSNLLPSCSFFSELVPDDREARAAYHRTAMDSARGCDLVFFDPDNGIEVKSKPYGRKGSSKYLYWRETEDFWEAGLSLLIYQHFPRLPRDLFIDTKASELMQRTGALEVLSFRTSHVVFFLLPQAERRDCFRTGAAEVGQRWGSEIQVGSHGH
jgi:hypothetical protein